MFSLSNFGRHQLIYINLAALCKKHNPEIRACAVYDLFRRDVWHASPYLYDWSVKEGVFRTTRLKKQNEVTRIDVGWQVKNTVLRRMSGVYDFSKKEWEKKSVSVIAQNVRSFSFVPHINTFQCVDYVLMTYMHAGLSEGEKKDKSTTRIYMRNGVMV